MQHTIQSKRHKLSANVYKLTEYVWQLLTKWNVGKKIVTSSADNTNINFGGNSRRGKNNVVHKLKPKLNCTWIVL